MGGVCHTLPPVQPFFIYAALAVLLEWLFYGRFLEMPKGRLLGRVALINGAAGLAVLVGALTQFLYGDWLFIHSWGIRDIFLFTTLIEFPFAWIALPKLPFPKLFSLIVLANLLTSLVWLVLVWITPGILGFPLSTDAHLAKVEENLGIIQSALEKYRTNHDGAVPAYIYGGDEGSWRWHEPQDRLLQEGLLEAYPKNPLHLGRGYLRPRQEWTLMGLFLGRKSPEYRALRDTWTPLIDTGLEPRFGIKGIRMGNVLSDPLIAGSSRPEQYRLGHNGNPMPGAFFYRAYDLDGNGTPESYLLGAIGSEDFAGSDVYDAASDSLLRWIPGEPNQLAPAADGVPDKVLLVKGGGRLEGYPTPVAAPDSSGLRF